MEFNQKGLLEPGFHDVTIEDIRTFFVDRFETSRTRKDVFQGYLNFIEDLKANGIEGEIWIDGSFVTNKIDPNDIDLLCVIDNNLLNSLPKHVQPNLFRLFDNEIAHREYRCDPYMLAKLQESHPKFYESYINQRAYWRGFFTYTRNEEPKGILRMKLNQKEVY